MCPGDPVRIHLGRDDLGRRLGDSRRHGRRDEPHRKLARVAACSTICRRSSFRRSRCSWRPCRAWDSLAEQHGIARIWFLMPITTAVLFPFALLSILETGSVLIPFSKPIFRCVYERPGTWIWFYGESTVSCRRGRIRLAALAATTLDAGSSPRIAIAAVLSTAAILDLFPPARPRSRWCTQSKRLIRRPEEVTGEEGETRRGGRQQQWAGLPIPQT